MGKKPGFPYRITFIYLVFGVCWIIFTDILLGMYVQDSSLWTEIQSVKGILYVIISGLIIFVLSKQYAKQQKFIKTNLQQSIEKAQESDKLKSIFLANISHEIRTPMNGILGFVDLLEHTKTSSENYRQYLGFVRKSSQRLLDTIHDIVEISKIQTGEIKLNVSNIDLDDSMKSLYVFFLPAAQEKGLSFRLNNKLAGKKVVLYTDQGKLESILSNLVKNAIKFTHEGSIELGIDREGDALRFYVKDTGIGIPEGRLEAIFDRFTQADLSITRPYEGSGLGLSISQAYAVLLGGKISVKSFEDEGSTFSFVLPLRKGSTA